MYNISSSTIVYPSIKIICRQDHRINYTIVLNDTTAHVVTLYDCNGVIQNLYLPTINCTCMNLCLTRSNLWLLAKSKTESIYSECPILRWWTILHWVIYVLSPQSNWSNCFDHYFDKCALPMRNCVVTKPCSVIPHQK